MVLYNVEKLNQHILLFATSCCNNNNDQRQQNACATTTTMPYKLFLNCKTPKCMCTMSIVLLCLLQWAEETEEKEGNYYYFAHFHQLNIFLLLFSWQLIQLNWQKFTSFCDCLISYQKHLFLAKDKTVFVATKGCKRAEWVPQHPAVNEQIWLPVK